MGRKDEGSYSVELCGGTHVGALGDIALFKILSESAVASGVRRIEALTGEAARQWLTAREDKLREAAAALKTSPDEVPARVASLVEARRRLEREPADWNGRALGRERGCECVSILSVAVSSK